ncbi:uncharacterized protein LOC117341676 [Pecten maximus]|uniref:uncharacterized protein LOC117341676 n=1 Tax=Pecten maximus TaxID=6579 RepID=UPI00145878D2|nr:uncharacterized protein LOC117341676 [Pecten maximus]
MRIQFYVISGTITLVIVSLGTMSLIRRLLRQHSNRIASGDVDVMNMSSITSSESAGTVPTKTGRSDSAKTSSTTDGSCHDSSSDVTSESVDCRRKRRKLSSLLRRKSKKELKLDRKQREILQIDAEIKEVMRMLKHIDVREIALDEEVQFKKLELISMFPNVTEEAEADVRRKGTLYHRRFTNIKTATDAKSLLTMIRTRKYALDQLEILTYRKYVNMQHDIESKDTSTAPPLNPCRPNFDHLFSVIRERIAVQQQPGSLFADFDASVDDVFPTISGSTSSTHNGNRHLRLDPTHVGPSESIV